MRDRGRLTGRASRAATETVRRRARLKQHRENDRSAAINAAAKPDYQGAEGAAFGSAGGSASNIIPNLVFITPTLSDDGHDGSGVLGAYGSQRCASQDRRKRRIPTLCHLNPPI